MATACCAFFAVEFRDYQPNCLCPWIPWAKFVHSDWTVGYPLCYVIPVTQLLVVLSGT